MPGKVSKDKQDHPDLFGWAETAAAKLGRSRENVWTAALGGLPTIFAGLVGVWSHAQKDSALLSVLAGTLILTLLLACVAFAARACRERVSAGTEIFLQGSALLLAAICLLIAVGFWMKVEFDQLSAARMQIEGERKAEKKLLAEQEMAAKAAKDATECLTKWATVVRSTLRRQQAAKSKLEECKTAYAQKFLPLSSLEATCRHEQADLEAADQAHLSASRRVCTTASTK
jgi:hypothetical protein